MKLVILAFLYCREFVKNSNAGEYDKSLKHQLHLIRSSLLPMPSKHCSSMRVSHTRDRAKESF